MMFISSVILGKCLYASCTLLMAKHGIKEGEQKYSSWFENSIAFQVFPCLQEKNILSLLVKIFSCFGAI